MPEKSQCQLAFIMQEIQRAPPTVSARARSASWQEEEERLKDMAACLGGAKEELLAVLTRLRLQACYDEAVKAEPYTRLRKIAHWLREGAHYVTDLARPALRDWDGAITIAAELADHGRAVDDDVAWTHHDALLSSVHELRAMGFPVAVVEGEVYIPPEVETPIFQAVQDVINHIGGVRVAERLVMLLQPTFDRRSSRFSLGQRHGKAGSEPRRRIPFGLLLDLCALEPGKHLGPLDAREERSFGQLIEISTALGGLTGAQRFTMFDGMFITPRGLIEHLRRTLKFAAWFQVPQVAPEAAARMMSGIWSNSSFRDIPGGHEVQLLARTGQALCEMLGNASGPQLLVGDQLRSALATILAAHTQVKDSVAPLAPGDALRTFAESDVSPSIMRQALFPIADGASYWAPPAPIASAAILAGIARAIELTVGKGWRKYEGFAVERHLREFLDSLGVTCLRGEYRYEGRNGEVDLVVESDSTVVLLEVKRRRLSSPARDGEAFPAVVDFAESVIAAQTQLLRAEIALRHGRVELQSDSRSYTLELRGRRIERVVISLHDEPAAHSPDLVRDFLRQVLYVDFNSLDPEDAERNQRVKRRLDKFRELVKDLIAFQESSSNEQFFNAHWFGIPFLYTLCEKVQSAEDFVGALTAWKHVSASTYDVYDELMANNRIRDRRKKAGN